MPIPGLPSNIGIGNGLGTAATVAIAIPGIRSGDILLGLIKHSPSGATPEDATAVAVATFTVANGTLTSASVSTAGYKVTAIWQAK